MKIKLWVQAGTKINCREYVIIDLDDDDIEGMNKEEVEKLINEVVEEKVAEIVMYDWEIL